MKRFKNIILKQIRQQKSSNHLNYLVDQKYNKEKISKRVLNDKPH